MGNKHEILLGLTTTPGSDWHGKIEEIKKFGIKKVALFPTFIGAEKRKELYELLEDTEDLKISHVHLRNDMTNEEIEYFINKYDTEVFNIHPQNKLYSFSDDFLKYADRIFLENLIMIPAEDELRKYAGLCIDLSHWEDCTLQQNMDYNESSIPYDEAMVSRIKKFPVGCCHVSAIKNQLHPDVGMPGRMEYCEHMLDEISEVDYVKKYIKYLPKYISLELENCFEEQLKVKKYLEEILNI